MDQIDKLKSAITQVRSGSPMINLDFIDAVSLLPKFKVILEGKRADYGPSYFIHSMRLIHNGKKMDIKCYEFIEYLQSNWLDPAEDYLIKLKIKHKKDMLMGKK